MERVVACLSIILFILIQAIDVCVGFQSSCNFQRRLQNPMLHASETNGDNGDDGSLALARALKQAEDREVEQLSSLGIKKPWYLEYNQKLPFDCTACGKCCQTKGNVYMSPEEIQKAAKVIEISVEDFIDEYASLILDSDDDNNDASDKKSSSPWIQLRNNDKGSCVFLGSDNLCKIYEARPSQCSTYPFWTSIMSSKDAWNAEVRKPDSEPVSNNYAPYWTPEGGGCEGMKKITFTISEQRSNELNYEGVDPNEAYKRLKVYERDEQRSNRHVKAKRVSTRPSMKQIQTNWGKNSKAESWDNL
mmetsp:Transcript_9770/g.14997  ORF Transcript_9770/g.14997 Transcript_9770/m.14997 type:complete len:304 (+) Transcript_9770:94-1005(+)